MAEGIVGLPALQSRLRAISGPVLGVRVMRTLAVATVAEAKVNTRAFRKTGNLGRTIHVESVTEKTAVVVASAKYAGFVERGTRAHIIRARAAKALRWATSPGGRRLTGTPRVGAAVAFAKWVRHPGTKAQPFLIPGAKAAVKKAGLAGIVTGVWDEAA